jgi:hypothetical protein
VFSTAIAAKARQSNYLVEFLPNIHRAAQHWPGQSPIPARAAAGLTNIHQPSTG